MKYVCISPRNGYECAVGDTITEAFDEYLGSVDSDAKAEDLNWYELGVGFEVETKVQRKEVVQRKEKLPK